MKKIRHKEGQASIPAGIAIGTGTCVLVSLAGAGIAAWLIDGGSVTLESSMWFALLTAFLASAAGAWVSILLAGRKKLQTGMLTCVCYLAVLFSMTALLFDGQYEGVWMGILAVIAGALLTSVLSAGGAWRPKKRLIKKAYR